ncbi:MAG: ArgR family transcriptional regulator [Streptococcaceae bacterium]|jgi:transcriptional regulator of arginine metabolism|nr:ArgR family transcriptional regulator [Streptococcaceae bacterium]
MRKKDRLKEITKLLNEVKITKQEEFVIYLKQRGILVTQATVSRDISELGLIKISDGQGNFRYALPTTQEKAQLNAIFLHYKQSIVSIRQLDNQLYFQTIAGSAMALKRYLVENESFGVFAMIADDDGLFVVLETVQLANKYKEKFTQEA